jgi:hypothetical protein
MEKSGEEEAGKLYAEYGKACRPSHAPALPLGTGKDTLRSPRLSPRGGVDSGLGRPSAGRLSEW